MANNLPWSSQVLLQVEAEELADRLNEAFDQDRGAGQAAAHFRAGETIPG